MTTLWLALILLFTPASVQSVDREHVDVTYYPASAVEVARYPAKSFHWGSTPMVIVCNSAPVSKARVKKAMDLWRRMGYELDGPLMNDSSRPCITPGGYSFGNIIIELNGQDFPEPNAAITRTYSRTATGEILGVAIQIKEKWSTQERVLEHEFGHALGWDHFSRKLHLMHPIHDFGGWDTYGLKAK